MKIKSLDIRGLYGSYDKNIKFDSKVNLLVGINGSGKTSILNIISWLLQPSIADLCSIEFSRIELIFELEGKIWTIECIQTYSELSLHLNVPDNPTLVPLKVRLAAPPGKVASPYQQRELFSSYYKLTPEVDEEPTWRLLSKIPSPIVVGLERHLNDVSPHFRATRRIMDPTVQTTDEAPAPLQKASQLAQNAYTRYRTVMLDINERLREKIMISAFDVDTLPGQSSDPNSKAKNLLLNVSQIDELEERVTSFFTSESTISRKKSKRNTVDFNKIAISYLQRLKELLISSEGDEVGSANVEIRDLLVGQFTKIQKLFRDFEVFEVSSKKAKYEIARYLHALNDFFADSNKYLYFSDNNELRFEVGQSDKSVLDPKSGKNIQLLSSGEKQIIILLTYIAFSPGSVFIIDEPELSLHPKWQEDFIDKVKELMPEATQLVIATHSPSLVGRHFGNCITLLPYNK